jgi:hypothetical protein
VVVVVHDRKRSFEERMCAILLDGDASPSYPLPGSALQLHPRSTLEHAVVLSAYRFCSLYTSIVAEERDLSIMS